MNRIQVGLGLTIVALGTAWAAGGSQAVRTIGRGSAVAAPVAAIAIGLLLLLRAAVPRGMLAGPLALIAAAGLWLSVWYSGRLGISAARIAQYSVIAAGVTTAMVRPPRRISITTGIQKYFAPLGPRPDGRVTVAVHKYIVRVLPFGTITLDFDGRSFPVDADTITVDATVLLGRFELCVPKRWKIVAGRVSLAYGIDLDGTLTQKDPYIPSHTPAGPTVVLNLQGLGGSVLLRRGRLRP